MLRLKVVRGHSLKLLGPNPTRVRVRVQLERFCVDTKVAVTSTPDPVWNEDFCFKKEDQPSRILLHVKETSSLFGEELVGVAELDIYWLRKHHSADRDINVILECRSIESNAESKGNLEIRLRFHSGETTPAMDRLLRKSVPKTGAEEMKPAASRLGKGHILPHRDSSCSLIRLISRACVATKLHKCEEDSCRDFKTVLDRLAPPCETWPKIRRWALQAAACMCSKKRISEQGHLEAAVIHISKMIRSYTIPSTELLDFYNEPVTYGLAEVLLLFAWLNAIATGSYESVVEPRTFTLGRWIQKGAMFGLHVEAAAKRAREYDLCPHRFWAVASNLPGTELNLLGLIPDKNQFPVTPHGNAHNICTPGFCEEDVKNFTNVKQLHRCSGSCPLTAEGMFKAGLLDGPAQNDKPTAWALDGLSVLDPEKRYVAISHIWADGTGGGTWEPGRVNTCLYEFFCKIARDHQCDGVWWDAICIPADKAARIKAINNMHRNYEMAEYTIVHDLYLLRTPWVDAESGCFHLTMSMWFSRGWTALELARSKRVLVLFGSGGDGYVVKDLDDDILAQRGQPSSPCRQAASMAVKNMRNGIHDINDLLKTLGPRYTSWTRDRAIIAALMVNLTVDADESQPKIYHDVLCKLGTAFDAQLFHECETMDGSWYPRSLFDLPVASSNAEPLSVMENGDVVGYWNMLTADSDNPFEIRNGARIIWRKNWPTESKIHTALRSNEQHIILLVERNVHHPKRGLLVKVMKYPSVRPIGFDFHIPCQFIGSVQFHSHEMTQFSDIKLRIGEGSDLQQLGRGEVGSEYVMSEWKKYRKFVHGMVDEVVEVDSE